MRAGSLRMSALIDDLLKFGKLTHQRVELVTLSLKNVCEDLLAEMKEQIAAANGTVCLQMSDESAQGNAFLLKQALTNLIGNGLKFVRQGASPAITLRARKERAWVVLEIED